MIHYLAYSANGYHKQKYHGTLVALKVREAVHGGIRAFSVSFKFKKWKIKKSVVLAPGRRTSAPALSFTCPTQDPRRPNITSIEKRGRGSAGVVSDAQLAQGGGDTEAR